MRIAIVGCGVVGGALKKWLEVNTPHEIMAYDPPIGLTTKPSGVDITFISVPVPTKSFKQDLSILKEAVSVAIEANSKHIFVRSSVLPGTCEQLSEEFKCNIHAMPEFLTERTRDDDMSQQDILLGVTLFYGNEPLEVQMSGYVKQVLLEGFDGKKRVKTMTSREAEMAKYAHNCFGAFKVTYFNAIYDLCNKGDMNYERVKSGLLLSGYINDVHTMVPGPDDKRGFGGKCFPKDLAAFMGWVGSNPAQALLKDVLCLNRFYRGEKDFDDGTADEEQG